MDGTVLVRLKFVIQMVIQTVKYVEGKMQLYIYGAALASAFTLRSNHIPKHTLALRLLILQGKHGTSFNT